MKRILWLGLAVLAACNSGSPAPAATDRPASTPVAITTPEPTPDNAGVITFGNAYDEDTLNIPKPVASFKRTVKAIAWSAALSEPVNATSIELLLASQTSAGIEKVILRTDVDVANPAADILANKVDLASLVDNKAGTYVMRYIRDGEVLAEGTFTLTK